MSKGVRNQIIYKEWIDSDTTGGYTEEKCAQTVWGLRYIDDAVLRRTDTNQDYDYADAGERTDYFITDPQFSVCAVVSDTGKLQERLAYSAYGEATHHFPADMDGDGDVDSTDTMWFTNLNNLNDIDETGYNADGDLNRDGSVNTQDLLLAFGWNGNAALANGLISDPDGPDNPIGYDGYLFNAETKLYTVRFRHYEPVTGRWIERDPLEYMDSQNMHLAHLSNPIVRVDTMGLVSVLLTGWTGESLSYDPVSDSDAVDDDPFLDILEDLIGGDNIAVCIAQCMLLGMTDNEIEQFINLLWDDIAAEISSDLSGALKDHALERGAATLRGAAKLAFIARLLLYNKTVGNMVAKYSPNSTRAFRTLMKRKLRNKLGRKLLKGAIGKAVKGGSGVLTACSVYETGACAEGCSDGSYTEEDVPYLIIGKALLWIFG